MRKFLQKIFFGVICMVTAFGMFACSIVGNSSSSSSSMEKESSSSASSQENSSSSGGQENSSSSDKNEDSSDNSGTIVGGGNDYFNLSSVEFAQKMGVGWNLGNTFESNLLGFTDNDYTDNIIRELGFENREMFCEVRNLQDIYRGKTTKKTIQAVYNKRFRSVRIPVSWSNHMDGNGNINEAWMDRIQEVVDYVMDFDNMFAIINIMDTPNLNAYALDDASYEKTMSLVENVWYQVAERFADYDARLIFENLNEPLHSTHKWQLYPGSQPDIYRECNENLTEFNQKFVDIVRSQGSKNNKNRFLTVNAYGNIGYYLYDKSIAAISPFVIPTDTADDKILINIHSYSPTNFSFGNSDEWSVETDEQSSSGITAMFREVNENLVQKGYGVVMSEWGSVYKNSEQREKTRVEHATYYMKLSAKYGICSMVWDNGNMSTSWGGEYFGLLNRYKASGLYTQKPTLSGVAYNDDKLWHSEEVLAAIFNGYKQGKNS